MLQMANTDSAPHKRPVPLTLLFLVTQYGEGGRPICGTIAVRMA